MHVNHSAVWCFVVALVGDLVGSATFVAFGPDEDFVMPFAAPGRGSVNQFLMTSLLIVSVDGLAALIKRREPGYLRIGPDGFENADILRTCRARWDDIVAITDIADRRARNPLSFVLRDAKPIVVPATAGYAAGGNAIYWMVRHYWKHPE